MSLPSSRTLGFCLGALFLVLGVVEVFAHRSDSAAGLAYWGVSLLGGGALVLAGTQIRPARRTWGLTLLTIGAVVASNATIWTLIVPIFALIAVIAAYRDASPEDVPAPGL